MTQRREAAVLIAVLLGGLCACKEIQRLASDDDDNRPAPAGARPSQPRGQAPQGGRQAPDEPLPPVNQTVVDEEVAVPSDGSQARGFTLTSPQKVRVMLQGVNHADKGFSSYMIPSNQWEAFKLGGNFTQMTQFQGLKVRSFNRTASLPAGNWMVVVKNSENIINTMIVRVQVVIDPA